MNIRHLNRLDIRPAVQMRADQSPEALQLGETIRGSPVVYADETRWKVGGHRAWLWVATNLRETVYAIESGRGFAEAASLLGEDYAGVLGADGWGPYRRFEAATLQTCLTHLLHRASEMLTTATAGAVRFPREVKEILEAALALRDRRDADEISRHGLRVAVGRLRAPLGRRLATSPAGARRPTPTTPPAACSPAGTSDPTRTTAPATSPRWAWPGSSTTWRAASDRWPG